MLCQKNLKYQPICHFHHPATRPWSCHLLKGFVLPNTDIEAADSNMM